MGLIIIKYYKYYYKSQIAYFSNFLTEFADTTNKEKILNKKFIFKIFYTKINSKMVYKAVFCYLCLNFIFSIILSFTNKKISSRGFCGIRYIYNLKILFFYSNILY